MILRLFSSGRVRCVSFFFLQFDFFSFGYRLYMSTEWAEAKAFGESLGDNPAGNGLHEGGHPRLSFCAKGWGGESFRLTKTAFGRILPRPRRSGGMADARDSKSRTRKGVRVQVPPPAVKTIESRDSRIPRENIDGHSPSLPRGKVLPMSSVCSKFFKKSHISP